MDCCLTVPAIPSSHRMKKLVKCMHAVTLFFIALTSISTCKSDPSSSSPLDVLVAFRRAITADPTGALSAWSTSNRSNPDYCSWEGILCSTGTHHVRGIQLANRKLRGTITPLLGQLSSLSFLNLSFNQLSGPLPAELARCRSLSELAINDNQLINGSIPSDFANLTRLQLLSAGGNKLTGELPALPLPLLHNLNLSTNHLQGNLTTQLAGCATLRILDLANNAFAGSIPASLGNLSHLSYIDLSFNSFSYGLPPSLANCTKLYHLNLYTNQLSGPIPDSWFPQLRHHLAFFSLGNNGCNGSMPSSIASCSKLEYIELGGNHFDGQILHSLLNCTRLSIIDLWTNSFNESLPPNIGTALPHLTVLGLILNHFYGEIPVSLSNCSELDQLILGFNYGIRGAIPKELFRLNKINQLDLQHNALTGGVPQEIGNASSVLFKILFNNNFLTGSLPPQLGLLPDFQQINFEYNQFTGSIPGTLGNCSKLFLITGNRNFLTGPIPSSFGNLDRLEHLILDNNQLSGAVPSSLSNCTRMTNVSLNNNRLEGRLLAATLPNMLYFDMSNNQLSGSLPEQLLGSMTQVELLDISSNNLTGSIPATLASCVNLFYLNLSANHLTGSIPSQLTKSLTSLVMLNLSMNSLTGSIPSNIQNLVSLQKLDLSFNSLTGEIPSSLSMLVNLSFLNVSYNNLQGEVPDNGTFQSFPSASFLGNPELCSLKLLHRECPHKSSKNRHILLIALIAAAAAIVIVISITLCILRARCPNLSILHGSSSKSFDGKDMLKLGFLKLTLQEIQDATNNFSPHNVLGAGGTGVVYKGVIKDGKPVAFKKLHLPRSSPDSPFFAEVQALGRARHRNLVRILGYFSDLEKNDILILEYMPNGNLDQKIHPTDRANAAADASPPADGMVLDSSEHDCALSWPVRVRLAQGIAEGLAYLHHDCPTPIIHLDMKPTNILLDHNLEARITDFGLARVMEEFATSLSTTTQHMRGTLGYTAPEYANMGKVSPKCDVYSFGILLLEMMTGKRPTDDFFTQGKTLGSWVRSFKVDDGGQFEEELLELCLGDHRPSAQQEQVHELLNVGLLCIEEDPKARPTMKNVAEMLGKSGHLTSVHKEKSLERLLL